MTAGVAESGRPLSGWERPLLGIVTAFLLVFGVAAVYSASSIWAVQNHHPGSYFALRQLVGVVVGGVMLTIVARLDYHVWQRLAWPVILLTGAMLLILVLPFAHGLAPIRNGARRWLELGPVSFQPSELANFAVVLWTAMIATKKGDAIREFKRGLVPVGVIVLPIAGLIALEPDLSTAVLLVALAGLVLFAAGAKIGHFLTLGLVSVPIVWHEITHVAYRAARLKGFLGTDDDLALRTTQVGQSIIGIGSGGLTGAGSGGVPGLGFGQGLQKLGFLKYAYADFIFSTIGEEWGFIGVTAIILLYAAWIWMGFRIAHAASDRFGMLLAAGLTALVGGNALLHIAVTLALVPTTGLPLPFISYGRSDLLMSLLATGIILSVAGPRVRAPRYA